MKLRNNANCLSLLALFLFIFLLPIFATKSGKPRKHFVLVHGACHGAWSWYKVVSLIRASGHNVTALDMATSGINPVQVDEVEDSISDYFQPLTEFMASVPLGERVILVGHSFGGYGIAQAMELFPEKIAAAVFVAAAMIGPNLNVSTFTAEAPKITVSMLDSYYIFGNGPNNPPTSYAFGPKHLATYLYNLSPSEDLALATTLVRPLFLYSEAGMSKELVLTQKKYGTVRRVFIVLPDENNARKDYQEWIVKKNPPNEVFEIEGADHMVMNSKPIELLFRLLDIAQRYS